MRILSVRLDYVYDSKHDGDEVTQRPVEARRDRLSSLGFDVSKMDDSQMSSYPVLGMTDAQFIELTIAGEKNMEIMASVTVD